ncbi:MAG TPA: FUSC family protein [Solirubrobacterales bacterium]|nr:FUSC family protein [Solirubrobacterales bacterium]
MRASPLLAFGPSAAGPALRRGALVAIPVGAALLVELGLGASSKGAVATGALFVGFPGLDAPARTRAAWQAAVTPLVGIAAALGVLTGNSAVWAVLAMALVGAAAGYCFAVSLRLSIAGLSVALALLVSQGLGIPVSHTLEALLFATLGGALQAVFSLCIYAAEGTCRWRGVHMGTGAPARPPGEAAWDWSGGIRGLRSNLTLRSSSARHALRFGSALAAGVAAYWLLGMHEHGFWIPLTILFVLRPEEEETFHRLILRAVGTAVGLVIATALSFWLNDDGVALAVALTVATAFAYGLLTVQYALFTAAITTYAVLLADTLGEPAFAAAGQRALATAIGIVIAGASFLIWSNPGRGEGTVERRRPAPPGAAAR